MWQFWETVEGISEACEALGIPVVGGNVSFYNETDGRAIYPTPVIGMVGLVDDVDHLTSHAFQRAGDAIVLFGDNTNELGGSEYLYVFHDLVAGAPPSVDLLGERSLQHAVLSSIRAGLVASAHDCAEGGLAVALAESALGDGENPLGVDVTLTDALPAVPLLFGEAQGRVVLSCGEADLAALLAEAARHGVPARRIGTVTAADDGFRVSAAGQTVAVPVDALRRAWHDALPSRMDAVHAAAGETA
jgi:phosphoribosylformylglycinamidine synthase